MLSEGAKNDLIEYRDGMRRLQDRVSAAYVGNTDPTRAKVGDMLGELLSLSVMDVDRQLTNRPGHTGDLAMVQHGTRLAAALLKVFQDAQEAELKRVKEWMLGLVAAIGHNLTTSAILLDHSLNPPAAASVN